MTLELNEIKSKYTFVSQEGDTWANVCIREGKFKDVIYNYGKVSINHEEENDNGSLPFRFEYNIIDNASRVVVLNCYDRGQWGFDDLDLGCSVLDGFQDLLRSILRKE